MVSEDTLKGPPVISLTTDFGLADGYVGVLKGVILSRAPTARLVDLSHEVGPQDTLEAAFLLALAWRYFPAGSIHVLVVDPGVGTARRRLAIAAGGHFFIGPDNGSLSAALPEAARGLRSAGEAYESRLVELPNGVVAVAITNGTLFHQPVSATFEGRDVFAPAAAHLAAGGRFSDLGPAVQEVVCFPAFRAPAGDGRVLHVDRFGNLITDIRPEDLPPRPRFTLAGRTVEGVSETYAWARGLAAIVGSGGCVEFAVPNGHAASVLGLGPGDRVEVI